MSKTWLLLDCNYLCHRAYHTTGSLQFEDVSTGVIYGFLRDLVTLQDTHNTSNFAFCWDYGKKLLRQRDYPHYKSNRTERDPAFDQQTKALRRHLLTELGYKNVFYQRGYEADDIIASICLAPNPKGRKFIIVSSDGDLYQLLGPNVSIWNPRASKPTTEMSFCREQGVTPLQWIDVKAIAGCKTDCIEGVKKGIGPKTAAKFLNGTLDTSSPQFKAIIQGDKIWRRNKMLVKLPYPGCETFELQKDQVNAQSWEQLANRLGMKTLRSAPAAPKRKGFAF